LRITFIAPGTVIVISSTVTPPSAIAPASAIAFSTDSARNTGTRPISRNATNTAALSITCSSGAKAPFFVALYSTAKQAAEKVPSETKKHTSGAKAPLQQNTSGTAEAVPLSKTGFFRSP
jgi:hypothetical protein